jgi:hypothetical protein
MKVPCPVCGTICQNQLTADYHCKDEFILVPLRPQDIKALIKFLYSKNEKDLTQSLVKTIMKYNNFRNRRDYDNSSGK